MGSGTQTHAGDEALGETLHKPFSALASRGSDKSDSLQAIQLPGHHSPRYWSS